MKSQEKDGNKKEHEPFFIVPSRVFDEGLNPYELSVLFYLLMRADNEKHTCFPSEKGIAKACGMGKTSVTKSVKSLAEKGLINKEKRYQESKNGLMRQTANIYKINLLGDGASRTSPPTNNVGMSPPHDTGMVATQYPPCREITPPIPPRDREINKTKPNITKTNITISTELSVDEAVEMEKFRFSFFEFKRDCFEILKNERGLEEEYVLLLDRALEHLWFKNEAEYEGRKYAQNEVRDLLCTKTTPDILASSVEFMKASKEPIRSPVAYLGKCILGGLVNGFLEFKRSEKPKDELDGMNGNSSFDTDDFFAAALRNSYGDDFKF